MEIDSLAGTSCGSLSPKNHHGCQDVGYGNTGYGVTKVRRYKIRKKSTYPKEIIEF